MPASPTENDVLGKNGRLGVLLDVDAAGRYEVRFRYRVGSPGQNEESVRLVVDGEGFDFPDRDLVNSDEAQPSAVRPIGGTTQSRHQ
jgi:hypothetical protein